MQTPPSIVKPKINEIGLSVIHDPEDAVADIIFVHGLQGHPRNTWTCEGDPRLGSQGSRDTSGGSRRGIKTLFPRKRGTGLNNEQELGSNEVFWPFDLLREDCVHAGILTWGYDSKVSHFFGGPANQSNIPAHAKNLLHALKRRRLDCPGRSFIFVAHSLGGIIVKDVLRRAAHDSAPEILEVYISTAAIIFLGTPHRGSSKAGIAEVVRKIVSVSGFDTTDRNIRALQVDSTELELIHELFMKLYEQKDRHFKVLTFQEAKAVAGISYLKLNERVVEPFSSSFTNTEPIQTINANHMSMCRFPSRDDEGYKQVLGEIQILVLEIEKKRERNAIEMGKGPANLKTASPSQATSASAAPSFTDTERKCIAILTQNISNAAEYKCSLPSRVEGTCQWILSNKQYCDWNLRKESCLLWISGYPGSGKTILSTYILEDLSTGESSSSLRKDLCYFFCDEKIEKQRDALAILRSLIHQLLMRRRQLIRYLKAAYDIQGPQFDQNFNELWRIFIAIASDKRVGPINVIVDAIDECEEITRERFLQEVIKFIDKSRAPGSKSPCIKFLLTSRPLVGRQYTKDFHLQIDPSHNHVEQDLRLVIQTKVEGIVKRTRCKPEVGVYLENALYSKADRTFLWVTLVLHLLEKSFLASQKDFKRIIDELPQTLTATYERFLNGISIEYQPLAIRLLHFLVGSSRPLTLEEIRILTAMQLHHHTLAAVEEDAQPNIQETIEGVLGPLIRIWDSRIYLVHQSLKEYLQQLSTQRENQLPALYGVDPQKSSLLLAEACVSYLLFDDFKPDLFAVERSSIEDSPTSPAELPTDVESVEQLWDPFNLETLDLFKDSAVFDAEACARIGHQYTFFDYSARHWAEHISSASTICPPELQKSVLLLTDASQPQGLNWFKFYWQYAGMDLECPRDFVPIVTASYFGHSDSLEILLREGHPIESNVGTRSIYWASRMGHSDVVDRLLQEQVNLDMKVVDGQSAFIAAVYFNRLAVVKRLMEDDGFISEEQGYRVNCPAMGGRTPLSIAAGKGLIEVVNQLLHHDRIQPDIADFDQWTPLFWSVSGNHLDVLQLLVADGRLFLNHVDKAGQNVLSLAASAGKLELVKYLMSLRHLEAHVADHKGRTALSWAAGNGHLQTTVFLRRSQRIDTSVKDMDGRNALSWACSGAHYSVVKYLIKYDPQGVDEEDVDGWTPLAWALFSQAPKIVQVLLDSGLVDVNKKDRNGRSALSFAASYGYLDVVQILLNVEGIEIDSKDNDGRTPLSHATRYPDIASLLQSLSN